MNLSELIAVGPSTAAQVRAVLQFLATCPPLPELTYKKRQLLHKGGKP